MTKRLVIITQKVDEHDDLLGFFVGWIAELAKHFSRIDVIALGAGRYHLPGTVRVHSLGKERRVSKVFQYLRFFWLAARLVPGSTGVFAHMSPIFAILVWPFALMSRSKLVLWYLHRSVTVKLRLAIALSDEVLTADAESLRIKHPKVKAIGHGIDIQKFSMTRSWSQEGPLRVTSVGRISPIKDLGTLIRAVSQARKEGHAFATTIVGKPVMPGDESYYADIKKLVAQQGMTKDVHFAGYIPHDRISSAYAAADVVVGLTPPGGIDKVLLEAMASGCIVLTSNIIMRKYLGSQGERLVFEHGNAEQLAERLEWIATLSPQDRMNISKDLQECVIQQHNLRTLAKRVAEALQ